MLFDQPLMLHDVELQIAHGELAGEADFRNLGAGGRRRRDQDGDKANH